MITTLDGNPTTVANEEASNEPIATLDSSILSGLEAKEKKLDEIRIELKSEFFGIDYCIDAVMDSIKTWYLMPQVITRPLVVNLWGLTGVGKTALVRSLITKLGFSNRFVEIQMDSMSIGNDSIRSSSICSILQGSSIEESQPGVVFLDEFQRFKTLDEQGSDMKTERFQDVWMLLSDGRFSNDYSFMAHIERQLASMEYSEDSDKHWKAEEEARQEKDRRQKERDKEKEAAKKTTTLAPNDVIMNGAVESKSIPEEDPIVVAPKYKRRFNLYVYEAETLKRMLRLTDPVIEIMTWPKDKVRQMVTDYSKSRHSSTIDYTKCLIFISGNLDAAFQMANSTSDCDTSADTFYEYTRKISTIEIKKALSSRFRPEQIARLGNNHIIYPSLNQAAYMAIIRRCCGQYISDAGRVCSIGFTVTDQVYQEIYDNSVYPSQGTRPVFTSIHKLFGSPLSDAILWGLRNRVTSIEISLDAEASSLVFTALNKDLPVKSVHIDFDIRARRKAYSSDFETLIAVHEAGHALVSAALFKRPPLEISINVASFKGGYNLFESTTCESKTDILNKMSVLLGGIVAEELVFGPDLRSNGCASDIAYVTHWASGYVRTYAMDGFSSRIQPHPEYIYNHNIDDTNPIIEQLVKDRREAAKTVLTTHRTLLISVARELIRIKKMDATRFVEYLDGAIPGLTTSRVIDVIGDYASRLETADV